MIDCDYDGNRHQNVALLSPKCSPTDTSSECGPQGQSHEWCGEKEPSDHLMAHVSEQLSKAVTEFDVLATREYFEGTLVAP